MDRLGAPHESLYRRVLHFYPAEFRARFGDEMAQIFVDQLRDARRGGLSGIFGVWVRTLGDLATTAVSEHVRKDRTMGHSLSVAPSRTTRVLGLTGILGGVWLVAWLLPSIPWGPDGINLRLVAFNVGAIAIVVALSRRLPASSALAAAIVPITALANAWYLLMVILSIGRPVPPEPDPDFRLIGFWAGVAMWWASAPGARAPWRARRVLGAR